MTTPETKLTFGKYRGRRLKELPLDYLTWMAEKLRNGEFHEWSVAAAEFLEKQGGRIEQRRELEADADAFLRKHGYDPKHVDPES